MTIINPNYEFRHQHQYTERRNYLAKQKESLKNRIMSCEESILKNPKKAGFIYKGKSMKGVRHLHITQNKWRLVFAICEEPRNNISTFFIF